MKISIKTRHGDVLTVEVEASDTIENIQEKIMDRYGIGREHLDLDSIELPR